MVRPRVVSHSPHRTARSCVVPDTLSTVDINDLALPDLFAHLNRHGWVQRLVELARDEDLGPQPDAVGDVTTRAAIGATATGTARIIARQPGTLCGLAVLPHVLHAFKADVDIASHPPACDGAAIARGTTVATLTGSVRGILSAERTLLNFLGRLSGIATRTAALAALVRGADARLLDTRKTTPGLRVLEKYAVRCGGGFCHRVGLYDAALFKDNHLAPPNGPPPAAPPTDLAAYLRRVIKRAHDGADRDGLAFVEVEVDTLDQLAAILADAGLARAINVVLLDNMSVAQLAEAVQMRDAAARAQGRGPRGGGGGGQSGWPLLEASGGITPDNLAAVAATGVERVSLGTLTHGATWLDFGLDMG